MMVRASSIILHTMSNFQHIPSFQLLLSTPCTAPGHSHRSRIAPLMESSFRVFVVSLRQPAHVVCTWVVPAISVTTQLSPSRPHTRTSLWCAATTKERQSVGTATRATTTRERAKKWIWKWGCGQQGRNASWVGATWNSCAQPLICMAARTHIT